MAEVIPVTDLVAGSMGECFLTIKGQRYNFASVKSLEVTMDKSKTKVKRLGTAGTANRATGYEITGTATIYYNTTMIRELLNLYKETGEDTYFDIMVVNKDPTSNVGTQRVVLKDCNMDGGILAKFDVDADVLDEDIDFTVDDFDILESFSPLNKG